MRPARVAILEPHPIGLHKDLLGKGNDLKVCRMVHGLDADDFWRNPVFVLLQVLEQFEFGRGRTDEQDRVSAIQGTGHLLVVVFIIFRVLRDFAATALLMAMEVVLGRKDRGFVDEISVNRVARRGVHMKNTSFVMVNPDGGMCRHDE